MDQATSLSTSDTTSLRNMGYREVVSPICEETASSFDGSLKAAPRFSSLSESRSMDSPPSSKMVMGKQSSPSHSEGSSTAHSRRGAGGSPVGSPMASTDGARAGMRDEVSGLQNGVADASTHRPLAKRGVPHGAAELNAAVPAFNPSVPAFNPSNLAFAHPSKDSSDNKASQQPPPQRSSTAPGARNQIGKGQGGAPVLPQRNNHGSFQPTHALPQQQPGAKSRLPVFSQLQSLDSGSDRGSSRRSDRSSPTNSIDSLTNSIDSMHTDGSVAPRMLIRELTQKMASKDESKAAAAAKKVFDIVRESCPTWRQNQTEICRSKEMLSVLAKLLLAGSERCRFEACRALGNIAFQNPGALGQALSAGMMNASGAADAQLTDICHTIVSSQGMMDGLKYVLRSGTCNSKHEAARVINNCAAYSPAAAELIVQYDGVVDALKCLCGQVGRQRTRAKAVGAFNCLSTYEAVRPKLVQKKVVEEALLPALALRKKTFGDGDEYKAMRADAVMASANLVGKQEFSVLASEPDAFKTVMKCLRYGLEAQVWAGVTWTAYSALLPLSKLTVSDCNKPILHELGLVVLLVRVLQECINKIELELGLECLDNMSFLPDCRAEMNKANLPVVLQKFARVYLREGDDDSLRRLQRLMWLLGPKSDSVDLRQLQHKHAHPANGRHIFISYAPLALEEGGERSGEAEEEDILRPDKVTMLRDALVGAGFRVWCQSPGGDIDEMAEAVSCASMFVLCANRQYKESCECRMEGAYAEDARRAIVVMATDTEIDKNFGWIHQLSVARQSVDFTGDASQTHPALMRTVNIAMQWLGPPRPAVPPASPRTGTTPQIAQSPTMRPQATGGAGVGSPQVLQAQAAGTGSGARGSPTHVRREGSFNAQREGGMQQRGGGGAWA